MNHRYFIIFISVLSSSYLQSCIHLDDISCEEGFTACSPDKRTSLYCVDGVQKFKNCESSEICDERDNACHPLSCTNGQLDEGETNADCGGVCPKCPECDSSFAECDDDRSGGKYCSDGKITHEDCQSGMQCSEKDGRCHPDACYNQRIDPGELAIDCGGSCAPCIDCSYDKRRTPTGADSQICPEGYFCDSAVGYRCNRKCTSDSDCLNSDKWNGEYCRKDYRCAPKVFETVWNIREGDTIVLPYTGTGNCHFKILWGDEKYNKESDDPNNIYTETKAEEILADMPYADCSEANRTHTYTALSSFPRIQIIGEYDGWGQAINPDTSECLIPESVRLDKLAHVVSFGPIGLGPCAFTRSISIGVPKDIPDGSKLTSLAGCFENSGMLMLTDSSDKYWDTSNVTDMQAMFMHSNFNQLLKIDTSQVINMKDMFSYAQFFDQPIDFDTSKVTNMSRMFNGARNFNHKISFDTSNVTDMSSMFANTSRFNQPIDFDTSKVETMFGMFEGAAAFDSPLSIDTSNVTDMERMFHYASSFNQPIVFHSPSLTTMKWMFRSAFNFDNEIDIVTDNVTNMEGVFMLAERYNRVPKFSSTSKVASFQNMFMRAKSFDQKIPEWDMSSASKILHFILESGISKEHFCAFYDSTEKYPNISSKWESAYGANYYCEAPKQDGKCRSSGASCIDTSMFVCHQNAKTQAFAWQQVDCAARFNGTCASFKGNDAAYITVGCSVGDCTKEDVQKDPLQQCSGGSVYSQTCLETLDGNYQRMQTVTKEACFDENTKYSCDSAGNVLQTDCRNCRMTVTDSMPICDEADPEKT